MVAEAVACGPVGDIGPDPAPEDRDVLPLVPGLQQVCPGRDDEGLLHHAGAVELLAEGEDLRFVPAFHLGPVSFREGRDGCRLRAVAADLFLEVAPCRPLDLGIGHAGEFLPDAGDDRVHDAR
jgi:hypothetical protein